VAGDEQAAQAFPLVPKQRCDACHRSSEPHDPAFHCFSSATQYSLCFDEHSRPNAAQPARAAAAEKVRADLLLSATGLSPGGTKGTVAPFLALAIGVVGFVIALRRGASARRDTSNPGPEASRHRRLPVVDASRCFGCHACVDACPHDVLEVERFVAVVARPDACCGLVLCAERCPNGSLSIARGEPLEERARLGPDLESLDQPGVYLAGDVAGQSLIRSAVEQGERATRSVHASLAKEPAMRGFDADVVVIGAGPAGLSAGLTARSLGLRVMVLEQARLAESIRAFPRGKLVLDGGNAPRKRDSSRELPLFVAECEKDELVRRWLRSVRKAELRVVEQTRVVSLARKPGPALGYSVDVENESGESRVLSARRVIVAVGQRGSPRRLDAEVPLEAQHQVHYFLSDARTFAGRRSVVVGLGDTAMEAAIALAAQAKSEVTVVYRGASFKRGKRKNLERVERLAAQGKIRLCWSSEVRDIARDRLSLATPEGEEQLPFDALFVLIGSLPDSDFLRRIGLR
jgi:thioredoxin reductase/NAD-dependent dihydropyrimidine dehydrogenase PreA subunit